jgi:hypothetical protein
MGITDPPRNRYQTGGLQHLLAGQIRDEVGAGTFPGYFGFSFVLSPRDKVIPQYHFIRNHLEFARLPTIPSFYGETFFRDVDMRQFDFIGSFEKLRDEWSTTMTALGLSAMLPMRHLNATTELDETYEQRRGEILNDSKTMACLRDTFTTDIDFYEKYVSS